MLQGLLSGCGDQGTTLHVLHGLIIAVASLVADRGFSGTQGSVVAAHGLSSCGSQSTCLVVVVQWLSCAAACGILSA